MWRNFSLERNLRRSLPSVLPSVFFLLSTFTPFMIFWQPRSRTKKPPSSAIHRVFPSFLRSFEAFQRSWLFSSSTIVASPHAAVAVASRFAWCPSAKINNRVCLPLDKRDMAESKEGAQPCVFFIFFLLFFKEILETWSARYHFLDWTWRARHPIDDQI